MARREQGFLSAAEVDFLNRWAGAMMLHFAWADKTDEGSLQTPFSVMIMMVAGGWPLGAVVAAMCDCFASQSLGRMRWHNLYGTCGMTDRRVISSWTSFSTAASPKAFCKA
jgi:hypothetical protein